MTGEPEKWAVLQAGTGEAGTQMLIAGHKLEIGGDSMIGSAVADGEARIAFDVGKEAVFFRNPYLPDTRSEMALPLISRGSVIGALTIQSQNEAAFSQEDITALQTMADQVANAIENVNLFEQSQKRATELSVLNEMANTFTQTLDPETIFEHMYQYTSRLMDARNFYIALYDKELDEIHLPVFKFRGSAHEEQGTRRRSGNGITEWIIRNRQPVLLRENAATWLEEHHLEMRGFDAQSWMGVPMMRGGEVIGVIAVQSYSTGRKYSQHDLDLLNAVASQAGIAIENARLFQQTQARAQKEQERATQERLVRTITERMRSGQDIPTILKITLDELEKAFGVDVSMIKLGDRDQMVSAGTNPISSRQPVKRITHDGR
jgi:GAF domain-containing protein